LQYTPNYNLRKPDGTDNVNIDDLNYNMDQIDTSLKMAAQEQFFLDNPSYDSLNDRIACTIGPGAAELFNGDARVLVRKDADTSYYINLPVANTIYYLYLQADGTYNHNTTVIVPAGAAPLWQVATGASVSTLIKTDLRAQISVAGVRLGVHLDETMPHRFTNSGTTYRWGLAVVDGIVNMVYEEVV